MTTAGTVSSERLRTRRRRTGNMAVIANATPYFHASDQPDFSTAVESRQCYSLHCICPDRAALSEATFTDIGKGGVQPVDFILMTQQWMDPALQPHRISIVIPVYQGEQTLPRVVSELTTYSQPRVSSAGNNYVVTEILLVFDHGPDHSAQTIRSLAAEHDLVRGVWLSRNFGQHPATLAGMASAGGDWVVTMDEDGQHDPAAIGDMLDTAMRNQSTVVYALPSNKAPHSFLRNVASKGAKKVVSSMLSSKDAPNFQSFRLVTGEVARSVAAYAGNAVYLDVALGWIASNVSTSPVALREEGDRRSGYHLRSIWVA